MQKPRNPPPYFHRSVQTMLVMAVLPVPMPRLRIDSARGRLVRQLRNARQFGDLWTRPHRAGWRLCSGGHAEIILCQFPEHALWLMKLEPGGRVGQEVLARMEESVVLSGSCYMDGRQLNAGDVYVACESIKRHELVSPDGCLLYVCGIAEPSRFVV